MIIPNENNIFKPLNAPEDIEEQIKEIVKKSYDAMNSWTEKAQAKINKAAKVIVTEILHIKGKDSNENFLEISEKQEEGLTKEIANIIRQSSLKSVLEILTTKIVNLFGFKTKKQKALEEEALIVGKNLKNMHFSEVSKASHNVSEVSQAPNATVFKILRMI